MYAASFRFSQPANLTVYHRAQPDQGLFLVFVIGVFVMRSAGCVLNDYVDRNIDPYVERTRSRPIASGAVLPMEALTLFAALGFVAVGLASMLNRPAQLLAVVAAGLTIAYPFFKRFVSIPQFILGAAFGWAVPMAFAAHTGSTPRLAWLVFGVALVWAVIYDTFYAMVDREDDKKLGVKSTAILFGEVDLFVANAGQDVVDTYVETVQGQAFEEIASIRLDAIEGVDDAHKFTLNLIW